MSYSDLESNIRFNEDRKGEVSSASIETYQEIPKEFLRRQADMRAWSNRNRAGDYHEVAAIPMIVVDKWKKEGFDVFNESATAILKKARSEGLDYFISTSKRI